MEGATKAPPGGKKTGRDPADRGKQGVKRSVLVDGEGVPLAVVVAGANINDHESAGATREAVQVPRPMPTADHPQHLCQDKGYDRDEVRALGVQFGFTLHIQACGQEAAAEGITSTGLDRLTRRQGRLRSAAREA